MKSQSLLSNPRKLAVSVVILAAVVPLAWGSSTFKVLYSFTGGNDGGGVWAGVIFDKKGNLYGTTSGDGPRGYGTVFKLKPQPDGHWTEKVLHGFALNDPDGYAPFNGITLGPKGSLYGTTTSAGGHEHGTLFQLSPGPSGWFLKVLYDFCTLPDCADGGSPHGSLLLDQVGSLYGTAGVVFGLTPTGGSWTQSVLYTFCLHYPCTDGYLPFAGLIMDTKGNLYGTTYEGGAYCWDNYGSGCGAVYKLKPNPDGTWTERVLHSFGGTDADGKFPGSGNLLLDSAGNLYGTTRQGGKHLCITAHCGIVFKLTRQPSGHWKETILHQFAKVKTGFDPNAGVVMDTAGNLYGVAGGGGTGCSCGVVYKLSPNPDGTWTYSLLHQFDGYDGAYPNANLILDVGGNLYGTTILGGPGGAGVVFELTP